VIIVFHHQRGQILWMRLQINSASKVVNSLFLQPLMTQLKALRTLTNSMWALTYARAVVGVLTCIILASDMLSLVAMDCGVIHRTPLMQLKPTAP